MMNFLGISTFNSITVKPFEGIIDKKLINMERLKSDLKIRRILILSHEQRFHGQKSLKRSFKPRLGIAFCMYILTHNLNLSTFKLLLLDD